MYLNGCQSRLNCYRKWFNWLGLSYEISANQSSNYFIPSSAFFTASLAFETRPSNSSDREVSKLPRPICTALSKTFSVSMWLSKALVASSSRRYFPFSDHPRRLFTPRKPSLVARSCFNGFASRRDLRHKAQGMRRG